MYETKAVLVSSSIFLPVATSFCINQAHAKTKVGRLSEIKNQSPCEYKKYCLKGGESYYLVDEGIVCCNCSWLYGRKRCEKYRRQDLVRF